ncbi:MAG: hydrogenase expression/formation protein HypE [Candidatus Omnitrophica bacterium]|nr:hydrogenase expression/formation protein HypE [Candidatus Omnitrophota bacterium]
MEEKITLNHGNGTKASYELIRELFLPKLSNPILEELSDGADIGEYVFSCDAFTVSPLIFPSSDIGKLSVFGTVNDICVSAAIPLYLSLSIIVEEGFYKKDLEKIIDSISLAAKISKVKIVTGDFKVVERRKIDKIFIITSGIGKRIKKANPSMRKIKVKDKIIVTGPIAEHGTAVLLTRNKIFNTHIKSDCSSLRDILIPLWEKFPQIKFMRDPTRGGLASVLNEISLASKLGIRIFEEKVPIKKDVESACEILGIDPYYLASEGQAIIIAERNTAKDILKFLKNSGYKEAEIIGEISSKIKGVVVKTITGGERILDFSYSLTIPRIC